MLISLANINAISLASSGLVNSIASSGFMNSPIVHELIGHEILHSFFSMVRGKKGKRLTRAQRRKLANRRRRWFTDNIIMHHKRLHDKNRAIVVSSARSRALAKKHNSEAHTPESPTRKWRERVEVRDRGKIIRGRVDARRMRARSRWVSVNEIVR